MTTSPVMGITEEILGEIERAGWKLVPVEPTRKMIEAGVMFGNSPNKVSIIYQSMVIAAASGEKGVG